MDINSMETMNKRKLQRKVNKIIRNLNKQIEEDELWKGRFYVRQVKRVICPYEDKSGLDNDFMFIFCDKKTGKKSYSNWYSYFTLKTFSSLAWGLNNFIVDDVKVWDEDPRPSIKTSEDFRGK